MDLQEVAAGVGEHRDPHRACIGRRTGEFDSALSQPAVLGVHVVDLEGVDRNPVPEEGILVGPRRRMRVTCSAWTI